MDHTKDIIDRFENAFQTHDPSDLVNIVADNCVLENTGPAPDGATFTGKAACVKFWTSIVTNSSLRFDEEKVEILADRALIHWRLKWGEGKSHSVRGVNIMRVANGKIIEALGYIKG